MLDQKRGSRVKYVIEMGGLKSGEDSWLHIQDAMIDAMGKFVTSLKLYIDILE